MLTPVLLIEFIVPGTPKSKDRPRLAKNGHTYTPRETQSAEDVIKMIFRSGVNKLRIQMPLGREVKVRLEVRAYLPNDRARDWDNIGKLVSDALNKLAYDDDSQIKQALVELELDRTNPRTEVAIYRLEET